MSTFLYNFFGSTNGLWKYKYVRIIQAPYFYTNRFCVIENPGEIYPIENWMAKKWSADHSHFCVFADKKLQKTHVCVYIYAPYFCVKNAALLDGNWMANGKYIFLSSFTLQTRTCLFSVFSPPSPHQPIVHHTAFWLKKKP